MNKKQQELLKESKRALLKGRGKEWDQGVTRVLTDVERMSERDWMFRWNSRTQRLLDFLQGPDRYPPQLVAHEALLVVEAAFKLGRLNRVHAERILMPLLVPKKGARRGK